ncbi:MAG: VWA domain-containing protein [Bacteroidaceae bacterium]|nr:VWA domain-containing protein [Bacteroidaceae bacterium]
MLRFAHPEYLYLLLLIPLLLLVQLYATWRIKQQLKAFGNPLLLKRLSPGLSALRPHLKAGLLLTAIALVIVVIARPQSAGSVVTEKKKGIEAIISIDVSNSMLAQDVTPNRLERSKMLISSLINKMQNDKIGLQIFAGEAYPQLPITNDYVSAQMFLEPITTGMVSAQGTNMAAAITLATKSFTQAKGVGKAIVLITDGEDHEEGAIEAAEEAAEQGMHVFVLGVGSAGGAEIPTAEGFLRNNSGEIVRTALNEQMCQELAEAGNGAYIHVDNSQFASERLTTELHKLQQAESEVMNYDAYNEQYQAVAIIALLLLIIELFVSETENPFFNRFKLFHKK